MSDGANNRDNTTIIEEIAGRESKPRLSHLAKFWLFAFGTTRHMSAFYLSAVVALAALRPTLAWAWNGYVSRLETLASLEGALSAAVLLSCFFLISFLSSLLERYTESDNTIECLDIVYANRMREFTQTKMFTKLARIPVEFLEMPKTNDKIKRLFDSVDDLYFGLGSTVIRRGYVLVGKVVAVAATALALFVINPFLVIIVALAPIPALISGFLANKRYFDLENETAEIGRKMRYFQDLMTGQGAKELYVFGGHGFVFGKWKKLADEYTAKEKTVRVKNAAAQMLAVFVTSLANVSGYIFAVVLMTQGMITLGALAAALQLANALLGDVSMLFSNLIAVAGKKNEASIFDDFRKLPSEAQAAQSPGADAQNARIESIEFSGVSYRYPGTENYVLHDVNVSIKKGEKVALVGENGAGKSTFVKLLAGQLAPSKGTVAINGGAQGGGVLAQAGSVSQAPARYETFTVDENVFLGDPSKPMDEKEIGAALGFAGLADVDRSLRLGKSYGGSDLSGGQWQKIAIARAAFRDRDFFILDEPTGNLDPIAEAEIFAKYAELADDKTVVFVTHRIGASTLADRIIVFSQGRIAQDIRADDGAALGEYARLKDEQAKWYGEREA